LSYLIAFAISVLAGVVSYYICKWLDGDSWLRSTRPNGLVHR